MREKGTAQKAPELRNSAHLALNSCGLIPSDLGCVKQASIPESECVPEPRGHLLMQMLRPCSPACSFSELEWDPGVCIFNRCPSHA